jgi:hypothetical protein
LRSGTTGTRPLGVRLAFTGVMRSREYEARDAPDLFGAVSLGWKW